MFPAVPRLGARLAIESSMCPTASSSISPPVPPKTFHANSRMSRRVYLRGAGTERV